MVSLKVFARRLNLLRTAEKEFVDWIHEQFPRGTWLTYCGQPAQVIHHKPNGDIEVEIKDDWGHAILTPEILYRVLYKLTERK